MSELAQFPTPVMAIRIFSKSSSLRCKCPGVRTSAMQANSSTENVQRGLRNHSLCRKSATSTQRIYGEWRSTTECLAELAAGVDGRVAIDDGLLGRRAATFQRRSIGVLANETQPSYGEAKQPGQRSGLGSMLEHARALAHGPTSTNRRCWPRVPHVGARPAS